MKIHFKKYKVLFIFLLILGISFRLQYINKPLYDNEPVYIDVAKNLDSHGIPLYCEHCLDEHGKRLGFFDFRPLFLISLSQLTHFFDLNVPLLRLSFVALSVGCLLLTFLIGKLIGGQKVGLFSMFLLAINRLHVEHSQLIDIDGSFLTFFLLLTILFFLKWHKSKKDKYLILFILSFVLFLLTKEISILFLIPLFFYFFQARKTRKFFEIFIIVFSIFFISLFCLGILLSSNFFDGIFRIVTGLGTHKIMRVDVFKKLYRFVGITTWELTQPLILLTILSIFYIYKRRDNSYKFLIHVLLIFSLPYIFILGITRYFVLITPIICLVVANYIMSCKIDYNTKNISLILLITFLCFISFYSLNIRTDISFLNNFRNNFSLIAIPYGLCIIPLGLYFTKYRKMGIIILISMIVGYNMFFAQEAINPLISVDYTKATSDAVEFIKESSIEGPIVSHFDISFNSNTDFYFIEYPLMNEEFIRELVRENKIQYVIYKTNILVIEPNVIEFLENNCEKVGNSFSKNVEIFRAYKC